MAKVYFPSQAECEIVELELVSRGGDLIPQRLLVDSGFTGESCLVLSQQTAADFALATVSA